MINIVDWNNNRNNTKQTLLYQRNQSIKSFGFLNKKAIFTSNDVSLSFGKHYRNIKKIFYLLHWDKLWYQRSRKTICQEFLHLQGNIWIMQMKAVSERKLNQVRVFWASQGWGMAIYILVGPSDEAWLYILLGPKDEARLYILVGPKAEAHLYFFL